MGTTFRAFTIQDLADDVAFISQCSSKQLCGFDDWSGDLIKNDYTYHRHLRKNETHEQRMTLACYSTNERDVTAPLDIHMLQLHFELRR
jgi:hypothetical protein